MLKFDFFSAQVQLIEKNFRLLKCTEYNIV